MTVVLKHFDIGTIQALIKSHLSSTLKKAGTNLRDSSSTQLPSSLRQRPAAPSSFTLLRFDIALIIVAEDLGDHLDIASLANYFAGELAALK